MHSQAPRDSAAVKKGKTNAPAGKRDKKPLPKDFEPISDRWRDVETPPYERNVKGNWYDPYNQNVLKGDYPILGQNTFLLLTATADNLAEVSRLPTASGVSSVGMQRAQFFGQGERFLSLNNLRLSMEFYHGQVAFRPRDWEIRVTPVFNINYLSLLENNNINVNVRRGANRTDRQLAFQELFFEKRLFTLSDHYDFLSLRTGIQRFNSDFRSFIFSDFNLGARLFGTFHSSRYQYNLAYFYQLEKDTNSELNTVFQDRQQTVAVANLYRQDLFTLGYTGQLSFHFNYDRPSMYFDTNGFPVRPAVIGTVQPHAIKAYYLGWTGDGHWGRLNVSHAFYQVFGRDTFNQLANRPITINAQMAALELSIDQDWKRYRVSAFYASGDQRPMDNVGQGFDTIIDQTAFAGGPFSFWNLQTIRLMGVNLVGKNSLLPSLRGSKLEGQANFVNPGLWLFNLAMDAELTPKLKLILNGNYLRFANALSVQQFINQARINNDIGIDYGLGLIYRPFLNNNAIFTLSATALTPLSGFSSIYQSSQMQFSIFTSLIFTY
ncbi:MAG: hypothetical protein ACREOI_26395 [bacterium]